jgi:hypothetical protein
VTSSIARNLIQAALLILGADAGLVECGELLLGRFEPAEPITQFPTIQVLRLALQAERQGVHPCSSLQWLSARDRG